MVEALTGQSQRYSYVDENRIGDHICYYSDLRKMQSHYPKWKITRPLPQMVEEIASAWRQRLVTT
jgi:CDP-paratose 2-epimerase